MAIPFHSILCLRRKSLLHERRALLASLLASLREENTRLVDCVRPNHTARPSPREHYQEPGGKAVHRDSSRPLSRQLAIILVWWALGTYLVISKVKFGGVLCYFCEDVLHVVYFPRFGPSSFYCSELYSMK